MARAALTTSKAPRAATRLALAVVALVVAGARVQATPPAPAPPGRDKIGARIITVVPQGHSTVLVVNQGGTHGVQVGDWIVHERGACRAQEVYPFRTKCTMREVTSRDIGNRTAVTIWPVELAADALAGRWTATQPREPTPPREPALGVREPAPQLIVYRRFDETRFTHDCLGFTPDGTAAYMLRGGSHLTASEAQLVLTRFSVDGTTTDILIGDSAATDEATQFLDELRDREGLLACHEANQESLPKPKPRGKEPEGWPSLAVHASDSAIFFWVDESHLYGAPRAPVITPRQLATLLRHGDDTPGAKTHPEELHSVMFLPGGPLHVLHLSSWGKERWIGLAFEPPSTP